MTTTPKHPTAVSHDVASAWQRLARVVRSLAGAESLNDIVDVVRVAARELVGSDGAAFVIRDGDECFYVDEDAIGPLWRGQRFPMSTCISGWAMATGRPAFIPDITADDRIPQAAYEPTFVRSLAMLPVATAAVSAAIGVYWAEVHETTPAEADLLFALAESTSCALESVWTRTALERKVAERTAELEVAHEALAGAYADLRGLARSLPGSIVMMFDRDLRYRVAEGQGLRDFGFTPGDMEGRTLAEALPGLARELEPRYRTALAGGTARWHRVAAGRTYQFTAAPVGGTDPIEAGVVIAVDVSEDRRRLEIQAALLSLARASADRQPLEVVGALVTDSLRTIFGARYAGLLHWDGDQLDVVAVEPKDFELLQAPIPVDPSSASGRAVTSGRAEVLRPTPTDAGLAGRFAAEGVRLALAAPVRVRGRLWGTISIGVLDLVEEPAHLSAQLAEFADLVGMAIGNNADWAELGRLALVDPLSELPNRRAFERRLLQELATASPTRPLGLVIIDLDHFKSVNDDHGHETGDRVLREVGRRLGAAAADDAAFAARLGGEEFVVLCPGSDDLEAAAERFRAACCGVMIDGQRQLTASAGVATTVGGVDRASLLAEADRALYASKGSGRDRTSVAAAP